MKRRGFMLVLGAGGAVVALAGCNGMPPSAVKAWEGPPDVQRDPRLRALGWAMLAPNPHNLQSWIADVREPGLIKLHVDTTRLLPETDPYSRQILIGCGAFLELLRMAAAQDGFHAEIDLLPEGEYAADRVDTRPFAVVRLHDVAGTPRDPLFAAVGMRRTTRSNYEARVPSADITDLLERAVQTPSVTTRFATDPAQVQRIAALAIDGYRVEFGDASAWGESARAMRVGKGAVAAEPSGIALLGTQVWFGKQLGLLDPAALARTDGMVAQRAISTSIDAARSTPAWVWLATDDNSRRSQLLAGRAYVRLDLQAAQAGLAIHPNSQVLQEFPAMQAALAAFHREAGVAGPARVQMLARLGYAPRPDPAPRRALTRIVRA